MKRTLLTLFAMLVATAMALPANAQTQFDPCVGHGTEDGSESVTIDYVASNPDNDKREGSYTVYYCGSEYDSQNDETTFYYEVVSNGSPDLSHWVLEVCEDVVADFISGEPVGVETGQDGSTSAYGIKWNTSGGQFSFTLDGNYGVGPNKVTVKASGFDNSDDAERPSISGPSCEDALCLPGTIPSWDGERDIVPYSQGVDPKVFIDLSTPNGFKSIEVLEGSSNTALVGIVNELGTGYNPQPTAFSYDGYDKFEWNGVGEINGPEPVAPTSVRIQFGPREKTGMRFMFRVEDQDGCKLDVDPVIDFDVPETVELRGNYPNPFNPTTSIEFSVPEAMDVRLDVYDAMGRLVKSLVNANLEAGVHNVSWNGTDVAGRQVASGAYFYRVQTGSLVQTKQMILLK